LQIKGLQLDLQNKDKVIETAKSELQSVTHVWYAFARHMHMYIFARTIEIL
jgi:hypothetical protein